MEAAPASNSYGEFYRCVTCDEWIEQDAMRAHAVVHRLQQKNEPRYDAYWRREPQGGDQWKFYSPL